jgi:hypothetical protein
MRAVLSLTGIGGKVVLPTLTPRQANGGERVHDRGFCIHVLTASGAACALLALMAAVEAKWAAMFAWLGVALVVDAVDGPLPRRLRGSATAAALRHRL